MISNPNLRGTPKCYDRLGILIDWKETNYWAEIGGERNRFSYQLLTGFVRLSVSTDGTGDRKNCFTNVQNPTSWTQKWILFFIVMVR